MSTSNYNHTDDDEQRFSLPERKMMSAKEYAKGTYGSPLYLIVVDIIIAAIVTVIIYYTTFNFFAAGGNLGNLGWVSSANGAWYYILAFLFAAGAGIVFGMSFSSNMLSYGAAVVLSILVLITLYLTVVTAHDGTKTSFWLWSIIGILLGVVGIVYGLWSCWSTKKNASGDSATMHKTRFYWAAGIAVVAVLGGVGWIIGNFKMSDVFS